MLQCDGYKMFHGTATIKTVYGNIQLEGTWLYRPDTKCWYCEPDMTGFAQSFPEEAVAVVYEDVG